MQQPELVLIVGDINIPSKCAEIPEQFREILKPNKIHHVLSTGNIGSKETYEWLRTLSSNFNGVKGDIEEPMELPETQVIEVGNFKIGVIHGHQVVPYDDPESLSVVQKKLNCDILVSGHTHSTSVKSYDSKFFINPGSTTGAFSPLNPSPVPSFILLVVQDDLINVFTYELKDRADKFSVTQQDINKNSTDIVEVNN